MDALPECAWDAEHGLVVLYRSGATGTGQQGYALAIELAGAHSVYFAGDFPADCPIWTVKVPTEGRFRLLFYSLDSPLRLNDQPLIAVAFDDRLRVDPTRLAGRQHLVRGWCLPTQERIEVPLGASLTERLTEGGWAAGARVGLTVARYSSDAPDAPRGPAIHPLRERGAFIDVFFSQVADALPLPADGVDVAGFRELRTPAIVVDLTPFGDLAESLRDGFCFIHRPHGPDSRFSHTFGPRVPLQITDDHRLLVWACDDACHLDHIGVYFSGGPRLRLRQAPGSRIRGYTGSAGEDCLVALFYGHDYLMRPTHAGDFAVDGLPCCAPLDMTEVELQLYAAWVAADGQLHSAAWRGAEDAGAFTHAAYAYFLGQVLDAGVRGSGREQLPELMNRHGVGFRSFAEFTRRPDLAGALLAQPRLSAVLLRDGRSLTRLLEREQWLSLSALLAAALEPDAEDLARWIEDEPLGVQRALWLFMLAGGAASDWRALAIPPAAADGDLTRLAELLRLAKAPTPAFIAATLQDLGEDPRVLTAPLRSLEDAQARADAIRRAVGAVRREIDRMNPELSGLMPGRQLHQGDCPRAFSAALGAGPVADAAALRRQVLSSLPAWGPGAVNLGAAVMQLRTRVVLWGLLGLLGAERADLRPAGPVIDFAPPPGPPVVAPSSEPHDESPPAAPTPEPAAKSVEREPAEVDPEVDPAFDPAADPDQDHRQLLLWWCLRALRHQGWEFPPPPGPDAGPVDIADVAAVLRECEYFWGLGEADEPQGLPPWAGARAQAQRRLLAQAGAAQQRAARYLQRCDPGGRDADLARAVARLAQLREYIAAETIWDGAYDQAKALRHTAAGKDLWARIGQSAADQWEALAAEIDRNSSIVTD